MAIYDRNKANKICLDDTQTLTVTIENSQTVNGHTEYVIKVHRGANIEQYWTVYKRYNDFVTLHGEIQKSEFNINLPPKKIIGNMDRSFIAQRQMELQNYINLILKNPLLASNIVVKKFLDPYTYDTPLKESALQQVSMALRSEINYELIKPIHNIGWRLRKHHFLIKSNLKLNSEFLLQWVDYGPDMCLEDREIQSALTSLIHLNHPNIEKLELSHCSDRGCFTVRKFYEHGTLKDLIYNSKPKLPVLKKYGNTKHSKPLSFSDISQYGRQIIETLIFLYEKGIGFGHLHLGNILLEGRNIKFLDIENTILGLPSIYRPFIIQHKKINTLEAVDVYSLGHTLFEMAFGYPLNSSVCDEVPPCPPSFGVLLELILSSESCKTGLPSLQELLLHPFFNATINNNLPKINFKLNKMLKQSFKNTIQYTEKRLQSDQKIFRYRKKMSKMQEILVSEEDINKQYQVLKESKNMRPRQIKTSQTNISDRKSPRSDSLTSNSTATSIETLTPPSLVRKVSSSSPIGSSLPEPLLNKRSALLDSICSFDKSLLHHRPTNFINSPNSIKSTIN